MGIGLAPAFEVRELSLVCTPAGAGDPSSVDAANGDPDDATVAYVMAARPPFDLLRDTVSQLAGVMVLAAAGVRNEAGPAIVERLRGDCRDAGELIRELAVPPRASHHHRHLSSAHAALGGALAATTAVGWQAGGAALDPVIVPMKAAYRHLQWATGALPGFEVVALREGCCSAHAAPSVFNSQSKPQSHGRNAPNGTVFNLGP